MTTLNVSGTAERFIAPERAVVHIRLAQSSLTRGEAYRELVAVHNALVERAGRFKQDGAATWFDASAPSTYSHQEYYRPTKSADQKTRMRYAASSRVSVKFQDFEKLGEWLAELADVEMASTSVEWKLTDATRKAVQKDIRGEAVRNARELAEDYAQGDPALASAVDNLKIKTISDSSAVPEPFYPSPLRSAVAMAGAAAPAAEMSPEDIRLSASISVVFEV